MDGWMGGWVDGWMGGWVDGWMGGWVDGCMDGWMEGGMGGWVGMVHEWMGGWVDGWMGGWVDGCVGGWHWYTLKQIPRPLGSTVSPEAGLREAAQYDSLLQEAPCASFSCRWVEDFGVSEVENLGV